METRQALALKAGTAVPAAESRVGVTWETTLREVDAREWDDLVPRDAPHLRTGFLKAVEESGFGPSPYYLRARLRGRLAGVAVAYLMPVDLLTLAPPRTTRWIHAARERWAPRLLYLSTLSCGPMITNCNHGLWLAEDLSEADRAETVDALLGALE